MDDTSPGQRLILARELSRFVYDDSSARRAAARGELRRIRRGIYVPSEHWDALDQDERYRLVCLGYAASRPEAVLAGPSAAAIWRIPHIGRPPHEVHVATDERRTGRRAANVRVHLARLALGDVELHDGVRVTSLARTVVDLAATAGVYQAMSAIDHVLHVDTKRGPRCGLTSEQLMAHLEAASPLRGAARAAIRIAFGEVGAATPAESVSRVTLALIGAPPPVLQQPFVGELGTHEVDFYFPDADVVGEVDGKLKYLDPAYRSGRTSDRVVYDEKLREDDIRRLVRAFGRWPMSVGMDPERLRARLAPLGVRVGLARPRIR